MDQENINSANQEGTQKQNEDGFLEGQNQEDEFKDAEGDTDSTQITSQASQKSDAPHTHVFFHKIEDHGEITPFPGSNPEDQLFLHPEALPGGGMAMRDDDGVLPAAVKEISKKVASQLLKGKFADVTKTPSPAYVHHSFTNCGLIKNDISNAAKTIKKASKSSDPVERMKGAVTYYVQSQFINTTLMQARVPVNPIIGESYQREMATGEKLYCEQLAHRPSITGFMLEDPDGDYTFHGHFYIQGWLSGLGTFSGTRYGNQKITFRDGNCIEIVNDPYCNVTGLLKGPQQQTYSKKAVLIDRINCIKAEITYNPWQDNSYIGMLKGAGSAVKGAGGLVKGAVKWGFGIKSKPKEAKEVDLTQTQKRSDDITVQIFRIEKSELLTPSVGSDSLNEPGEDGEEFPEDLVDQEVDDKKKKKKSSKKEVVREILSQGEGSWLSHLKLDDEIVWRIQEPIPLWQERQQGCKTMSDGTLILPSDSDFRPDLAEMILKNWEQAEHHKVEQEQQQRNDEKLRKEAEKRRAAK